MTENKIFDILIRNMKKVITKLTKKQLAKIPEYVDNWTKFGLSTKQKTQKQAEKDFYNFQKYILLKENPAPVVLLNSPAECWVKVVEAVSGKTNIPAKEMPDFVYPYFDCAFAASFFAFYEYANKELGIEYNNMKEYNVLKKAADYGMVFPVDNMCVVCQRPTVLKTNKSGLHCEDGPAVSFNGKNEIYALNGVVMNQKYIMTSAEKILAKDILAETNVEIRRELIRKVGIERLFEQLPHKLLDKKGNYELFSIDLSDEVKNAKYLKMTNPSISVFHMEGVAPEIATVDQALNWRNNNMFIDAEALT